MLDHAKRRKVWLAYRSARGHLRTLFMIAAHTKLWPPTLRRLVREVNAVRSSGFDPAFYAFSHLGDQPVSPFWHYILKGRHADLEIRPQSAEVPDCHTESVTFTNNVGPKFSVVLPTRNRRHLLERAIESVLCQTEQDFELLIVDDGSTDGTAPWLRGRYTNALAQGRVRLIAGSGEGVSSARNAGLQLARGRWVTYLDSDNYWLPCHLASHRSALQTGASVALSSAVGNGQAPTNYQRSLHLQRTVADMNGLSHERTLTEQLGGFDPRLIRYEDFDLMLRICRSHRPTFLSEATFVYLIQPDSLSVRAPVGPNRARLYANHALERVVAGLDKRRIMVSKSAKSGFLGEALVNLASRVSRASASQLVFATSGDVFPVSADTAVYLIGEPQSDFPGSVAAFVSDRGSLNAPRITPEELRSLVELPIFARDSQPKDVNTSAPDQE